MLPASWYAGTTTETAERAAGAGGPLDDRRSVGGNTGGHDLHHEIRGGSARLSGRTAVLVEAREERLQDGDVPARQDGVGAEAVLPLGGDAVDEGRDAEQGRLLLHAAAVGDHEGGAGQQPRELRVR